MMMHSHHPHAHDADETGFARMTMQTGTALPSDPQGCHRRFLFEFRHIALLFAIGLLLGVALPINFFGRGSRSSHQPVDELSLSSDPNQVDFRLDDGSRTFPKQREYAIAPRICWLMSFPNSGTSFTSKLVRHLSGMSTATNYGEENKDADGNSIPIYEKRFEGPFWIDPSHVDVVEHPKTYALTKTHCGGRCEKCGPSKYVENPHSFLQQCLKGSRAYHNRQGRAFVEETSYDPDLVYRAVHLIRNPFNNVVSRFHLELHHLAKRNATEKLALYPASREGFRAFCMMLNDKFEREEETSRWMDPRVYELTKDVPCHSDLYRYVQWHNLAFITTQANLGIPTLVLHYEDYETKFDKTVGELFRFLEMEPKGEIVDFVKGKDYVDYFTEDEREAVKMSMKILALATTWQNIQHYF